MTGIRRRAAHYRALTAGADQSEPSAALPGRLETDRDWARFAQVYAQLVEGGYKQPLQHMVRVTGISRNTLSARVQRARQLGLLTRPSGRDLGSLTEKARALLADEVEN